MKPNERVGKLWVLVGIMVFGLFGGLLVSTPFPVEAQSSSVTTTTTTSPAPTTTTDPGTDPGVTTTSPAPTTTTTTSPTTTDPSTNADLSNLKVSVGTLSPDFSATTYTYSVIVGDSDNSIGITPTTSDPGITLTVDDVPTTSGATVFVDLAVDSRTVINVGVSSPGGQVRNNYSITVTKRAPIARSSHFSSDATLSSLGISDGNLAFAGPHRYVAAVVNSVATTTITAITSHPSATVVVTAGGVEHSLDAQGRSPAIALGIGENNIGITVTAEDGATTLDFSIVVTRKDNDQSGDFTLSSLVLSEGTLNLVPATERGVSGTGITHTSGFLTAIDLYKVSVPNSVETITVTPTASSDSVTSITLSGDTVSDTRIDSGARSLPIPLMEGQFTTIRIQVIAEDPGYSATYIITVSRADSTVATLSNIEVLQGSLAPDFISSTRDYTASVANSAQTITLRPTATHSAATIAVNGTPVVSGEASSPIPVTRGSNNEIIITVTAQDGSTTATYNVRVSHLPASSADATLSSLGISGGNLVLSEDTDRLYSAVLPSPVSSTVVTAITSHPYATVVVTAGGVQQTLGETGLSSDIALTEGDDTTITIEVTAEDGTTTLDFSIVVRRKKNSNTSADGTLSSLILSEGILVPDPYVETGLTHTGGFIPAINRYTVSVSNSVESITVTPTASSDLAFDIGITGDTIDTNNPLRLESGMESSPIALIEDGDTEIMLHVADVDSTTLTIYTITVSRGASSDATLSGIELSQGSLNPTFDSGNISYTAEVAYSVENITLRPTATHSAATIEVNGATVVSGEASLPIPVTRGSDNEITITVTAQDGSTTTTYEVRVSHLPASSDATLSSLGISGGNLVFQGNFAGTLRYAAVVPRSVSSTRVTAITSHPFATAVFVVGGIEQSLGESGGSSPDIGLSAGRSTRIMVTVTAEDGTTTLRFEILVIGEDDGLSADNTLSSLTISDGTLVPDPDQLSESGLTHTGGFLPALTEYTVSVANSVETITLRPTTTHSSATITVNGSPVVSGVASSAIALTEGGDTEITIVVTAQDGSTNTYTITVSRAISSDATLSNIEVLQGSLAPDFVSSTRDYTASVANSAENITLRPTATHSAATIEVNGATVVSGEASLPIPVTRGSDNEITITVTAQDGSTTATYNVRVSHLPVSSDATLSSLEISGGNLVFQASLLYSTSVPNSVSSTRVTAVTSHPFATVVVEDPEGQEHSLDAQGRSPAIALRGGLNEMNVTVTAEDGTTTLRFRILVERRNAGVSIGTRSRLSSLTISEGTLVPVGENGLSQTSGFLPVLTEYTVSVPNSVGSITVTPTAMHSVATIEVNGATVISGDPSSIPLSEGPCTVTTITIKVTAENQNPTTYSIEVGRDLCSDATLSGIGLSQGSLNPTFDSGTTTYTAQVAHSVQSITVIPAVTDSAATITVNGSPVVSGVASSAIALTEGDDTTITIVVTAPDLRTTTTYEVRVSHLPANSDATLSSLGISGGNLVLSQDTDRLYSAVVPNSVSSTRVTAITSHPFATAVFLVGGTEQSLDAQGRSPDIGLSAGSNTTIIVTVTAEDGTTTLSFRIHVVREDDGLSADNTLSSLTISDGTLVPDPDQLSESGLTHTGGFLPALTEYTVSVANSVETITLRPTSTHSSAAITVNGTPVTSGEASSPIALTEGGDTEINIVVTAQDGSTEATYTIIVSRGASSDATLSGIELSQGSLSLNPTFDPAHNGYTVDVANDVTTITVTPTTTHSSATIEVDGEEVGRGLASSPIPLREADTTIIIIRVIAQDGLTDEFYGLLVSRAASSDATLSGIGLSDSASLSPNFDSDTTIYTTDVRNSVATITVRPTATHSAAAIEVNGATVVSGSDSSAIPLTEDGETTITIVVTAQDGTSTDTYTITVTRFSGDNTLSGIQLSGDATLSPNFDPTHTTYTVDVANSVATLTVTPTTTHSAASALITAGGTTYTRGQDIPLTEGGDTTINIVVTAQDTTVDTKTYTITVTRAPSRVNTLSSIGLPSGARLFPNFSPTLYGYTVEVPNHIETLTVTPTVTHSEATIEVNGVPVASGSASSAIPLTENGDTSVEIFVTPQDQDWSEGRYSLIVRRSASFDATLSAIDLSSGDGLTTTSQSDTITRLTASIANNVETITVTPTARHPDATIEVNGAPVISGEPSLAIALTEGAGVVINIVVTAQDGSTTRTYQITASRAGSTDTTLTSIQLSDGAGFVRNYDPPGFIQSIDVANSVEALTVTPTARHSAATITVNGEPVASGSASSPIPLIESNHIWIDVVVTSQDGGIRRGYYYFRVQRARNPETTLSSLRLSGDATLSPDFTSIQNTYTAKVANDVETITVTPITTRNSSTVRVNGEVVVSGSDSSPIALKEGGETEIEIEVTAQDRFLTRTYTITVSRAASTVNTLSDIELSNSATLDPTFASGQTTYTTTVDNNIATLTVTPTATHSAATITVNGATVISGDASSEIALTEGDDTEITIVVTAQDITADTNTYTITVSRAASTVNTLDGIELSNSATLDPTFASGQTTYTTTVDNNIATLTVTPTATHSAATITVNGATVISGDASSEIALTEGDDTTITIVVTAQDITADTNTYQITVSRDPSTVNTLSDIELSNSATLDPTFASGQTTYTTTVDNNIATLTVTPTATHSAATITVNGATVISGDASSEIALTEGDDTTITIVVTAQDITADTNTYTITVSRDPSTVNTLSGIELSNSATLDPTFASGQTTYTTTVDNNIATLTVTPTATHSAATITVNGATVISGDASSEIALTEGAMTTITIVVTAQDTTADTNTYTITVSRAASTVNTLSDIELSNSATLDPTFASGQTTYTTTVDNNIATLTVTPTATHSEATIAVNGAPVDSGADSTGIPLTEGDDTTITIVVTAQDTTADTKTYTITVSRAASTVNTLSGIGLSGGASLVEPFAPETTTYTVSVANDLETLTVTPTATHSAATIEVNGTPVASGADSTGIPLTEGDDTTITIVVTAQDTTADTKTYTITVSRAASTVNTLSGIGLSGGASLVEPFAPETTTYTVSVANDLETLTVRPTATHNEATIEVNGTPVASGADSTGIPLTEGGMTTINIVVTAQDTTADTKTYTITVSRAASTVNTLSGIELSNGATLDQTFDSAVTTGYTTTVDNNIATLTVTPTATHSQATITVNGTPVASGADSTGIALTEGDDTTITIVVTAQDTTADTKTYTITVSRAASTVNTLSGIGLSGGASLVEPFAPETTTYTVSVANDLETLTVTPTATHSAATITVNGATVISGDASSEIALTEGDDTTITIVVTAQDITADTKTYTITVSRAASTVNTLSDIELSNSATLDPTFASGQTTYTTTVANSVATLTVTPTATHSAATITVNGAPVASGADSTEIPLTEGDDTTITIVVTAQDTTADTKTYTITVSRAASTVNTLSDIELSNSATLDPTFASGQTTYTTTVDNNIATLTVTPTATHSAATIEVNGAPVASGADSTGIPLTEGDDTTITIVVTAQDITADTKTYTITVSRAASTVNTLSGIGLSGGASLVEPFAPETTTYTVSVANDLETLTVTPTATHSAATIEVNGATVISGDASSEIALTEGDDTEITIVVTAQDITADTKTYTITVSRAASTVNTLSDIELSNSATLDPTFASGQTTYTTTVDNNIATLTVTPTATHSAATIEVNGATVISGDASSEIALTEGDDTEITIVVTAQDITADTKTYTITVSRAASTVNTLSGIGLSNSATLDPTFASGQTTYTTTVDNNIATLTVRPTATHSAATIEVNGAPVASGADSTGIPLTEGDDTEINIVVTAQDTTADTKTYTITVSRAASTVNTLSGIGLSGGASLVEPFAPETTTYTVSVANDLETLTVRPTATHSAATIEVNGTPVASGADSTGIPLTEGGMTTIEIVVTAQDTTVDTKTYTITVSRAASTVNTLSDIELSNSATLDPTFASGQTTYTTTVANSVATLTVRPTATHSQATITVNGAPVASGADSTGIPLTEGGMTTITIVVTAQDITADTNTYQITVSRASSTVNTLSGIGLSGGASLVEPFAPETTTYTVSVDNNIATLTVTPTATHNEATIEVNGATVASGADSTGIPLTEGGMTTINIVVTAQDTTADTKTYQITVSRAASTVNTLSGIELSNGATLDQTFNSAVTTGYTTTVDNNIATLTVTPTATHSAATITVNGATVISGDASSEIALTEGDDTTITIVVTAQDITADTKTYTITVSRAASTVNTLSDIELSNSATLDPTFASGQTTYTTTVANSVATLTVRPTATHSAATIEVNGAPVASGADSTGIPLTEGDDTTITIVVTAQDTTADTKTYTITVSRAASTVNTLSDIELSNSATLDPTFASGQTTYTTTVDNNIATLTVTPTATHSAATITVNGATVISGDASSEIALTEGDDTTITIVVTAQDITADTKTYTITVSRAASTVNTLSGIGLSNSATLDPTFASGQTTYTTTVANSVATLTVTPTATHSAATITVNGATVISGDASSEIALTEGDDTTITIVVTAQDTTADTKTYTITVSRAASTVNTLSDIELSNSATLDPTFASGQTTYTTTVDNNIATLTVTPTATHSAATITVNGATVISGDASSEIALTEGDDTTITIVVTAQDITADTKTYTITVRRAASTVNTLSGIGLSNSATLDPTFASGQTTYTTTVDNNIATLTVTPTATHSAATITVNGAPVASGADSTGIPLTEGDDTTITIVVTAQDITADTKTYTITVRRAASTVNTLSGIGLSNSATLDPTFASGQTTYTTTVDNNIATLTVTPTATHSAATITVNGAPVASGADSTGIPLTEGDDTTITIVVTAQDITADTKTYTITVSRAASTVNTLSDIELSNSATLDPTFASGQTTYTTTVDNNIATLTVTPTATHSAATITVNGATVISGDASSEIPLTEGDDTTITIVVTAQDTTADTKTYTITVSRAASTVNTLSDIELSNSATLDPTFASGQTTYTTTVDNNIATLTVTPTATHSAATIEVNGAPVASGADSTGIPLTEGDDTTITIVVTAQDITADTKTYTITVSRAASTVNTLSGIGLSNSATLDPTFASGQTTYTTTVDNNIATLTVTPTATHSAATIEVNGATVISGDASSEIALTEGDDTEITIVVTAQDITADTKTYTITVSRAASTVNTLSDIELSNSATLDPTFASGQTTYTTTVDNNIATLTVTPTATHSAATIEVNGAPVASGADSTGIPLTEGDDTTITIVVTAQDITADTKTYTITVSRAASTVNTLSDIELSNSATLDPTFASGQTTYTTTVDNNIATLTVTPTATHSAATITVNGATVISGDASSEIALTEGDDTEITIVVTAQDITADTKTYTITVSRAASTVNTLSDIELSNSATLDPTFASGQTTYTTTVDNNIATLTVTPTATHSAATIEVNGATVISGDASSEIALTEGDDTEITIVVTAQDITADTKTYTITVSRAASTVNTLSGIGLSGGASLVEPFAPETTTYTVSVANDLETLTVTPTATHSQATITVNGATVISGDASSEIALTEGDDTTITIVVTAQDITADTKTYTITVSRAASTVNTLSGIGLSGGASLVEPFAPETTTYTVSVANDLETLTVTPTATHSQATITVNGATVISGDASSEIALTEGDDTTITIVVTAQDITADTKTYTITVSRAASTVNTLSGIGLSGGASLVEPFAPETTTYTVSVANDLETLTVTPTATHSQATITVNGAPVASGADSTGIPLTEGGMTTITIVVTAQDTTADTKTYTITVSRAASTVNTLSGIGLSGGASLVEPFAPETTTYTVSVANDLETLTVTPTATHSAATITVNGAPVASGADSSEIALTEGDDTTITIVVTAQDITADTKTYTITVSRAASTVNTLSDIELSNSATLDPTFASGQTTYTTTVDNNIATLTVTPTATHSAATITVNGATVISGDASSEIALTEGDDTTITIVVTAQDITADTKTYTITVSRAASTVNTLSDIELSNSATLDPTFASGQTTYTTTVDNNIATLTVTPTATHSAATITVNGAPVISGDASSEIALTEGDDTTITIVVTAQDITADTKTYTITVSRAASTVNTLSGIGLSNSATLDPTFASGQTTYTTTVDNNIATLTVTPTATHSAATITVNGAPVASGADSTGIPLTEGDDTTITIVVTAQDSSTNTYTITVSRTASSDATLSGIQLSGGASLVEPFVPETTTYTVSVANDLEALTVTPTATHSAATISMNGTSIISGSVSSAIALTEGGDTTINIVVTAQDNSIQTYAIMVARASSPANALSNIELSDGATLSPTFVSSTTSYTTTVANNIATITVTPTATHSAATISVNGSPVTSGSASSAIALTEGDDTIINIVVTAQDSSTNTYTITVSRAASTVNTLSDIELSNSATLDPTFDSGTTTGYTASVANNIATITVTPTATHSAATISVNGSPVTSGSASSAIALTEGDDTIINIVVTAQDSSTNTYTITVSRAASTVSDFIFTGTFLDLPVGAAIATPIASTCSGFIYGGRCYEEISVADPIVSCPNGYILLTNYADFADSLHPNLKALFGVNLDSPGVPTNDYCLPILDRPQVCPNLNSDGNEISTMPISSSKCQVTAVEANWFWYDCPSGFAEYLNPYCINTDNPIDKEPGVCLGSVANAEVLESNDYLDDYYSYTGGTLADKWRLYEFQHSLLVSTSKADSGKLLGASASNEMPSANNPQTACVRLFDSYATGNPTCESGSFIPLDKDQLSQTRAFSKTDFTGLYPIIGACINANTLNLAQYTGAAGHIERCHSAPDQILFTYRNTQGETGSMCLQAVYEGNYCIDSLRLVDGRCYRPADLTDRTCSEMGHIVAQKPDGGPYVCAKEIDFTCFDVYRPHFNPEDSKCYAQPAERNQPAINTDVECPTSNPEYGEYTDLLEDGYFCGKRVADPNYACSQNLLKAYNVVRDAEGNAMFNTDGTIIINKAARPDCYFSARYLCNDELPNSYPLTDIYFEFNADSPTSSQVLCIDVAPKIACPAGYELETSPMDPDSPCKHSESTTNPNIAKVTCSDVGNFPIELGALDEYYSESLRQAILAGFDISDSASQNIELCGRARGQASLEATPPCEAGHILVDDFTPNPNADLPGTSVKNGIPNHCFNGMVASDYDPATTDDAIGSTTDNNEGVCLISDMAIGDDDNLNPLESDSCIDPSASPIDYRPLSGADGYRCTDMNLLPTRFEYLEYERIADSQVFNGATEDYEPYHPIKEAPNDGGMCGLYARFANISCQVTSDAVGNSIVEENLELHQVNGVYGCYLKVPNTQNNCPIGIPASLKAVDCRYWVLN